MGVQERTVESRIFRKIIAESWGFRKVQWCLEVSGKHSGVTGFRKAQRSHGFSGKLQLCHGVSGKHSGVTDFQENYSCVMGFQESTVESWDFRKVHLSHGVSGSTFESRGFRKAQRSHGFSGKYSRVLGFQERTVESRSFRKVQ